MKMPIIDIHVHIYPPERQYKLIRWIKKSFPEHPVDVNVTPDGIMKDLEDQGVTRFINLIYPLTPEETGPLNEFNADFIRTHNNAEGFASIHPKNDNKEKIIKHAIYELGLLGLKFHPFIQRIDLRDPAMEEIFAICEKLERPVFLHTGYESFYKRKLSPQCVNNILKRHPGLSLVINHACFPDLLSAFDMARRFKGVYIDLTNVPGSIPYFQAEFNGRNLKEVLLNGIREFTGRIFFGTDHPVGMGGADEILKQFADLGLSNEEFKILAHDAASNFIKKFKL
ncbi:MAG: amidohydrolase [Spirochaetes bacterium]|jgi:hypothetical protein|nr:amidohydrolase [Spirochaetota bacterium]